MFSAMGFTAGPQYPPWLDEPPTFGRGTHVSRSTPTRLLMVLMSETASAPAALTVAAMCAMSVTFGVSFTMTGTFATSFTHEVMRPAYSGTCPPAAPTPRPDRPGGHPKWSPVRSAPEGL